AEDGIRDRNVTGVQTCALPIFSDARMSGTSYGTCSLHAAPEAAVGGPLAALRTGDLVELDVDAGSLNALVDGEEWAQRLSRLQAASFEDDRGWVKLYRTHVNQADSGCDFDFLAGVDTREPEIL